MSMYLGQDASGNSLVHYTKDGVDSTTISTGAVIPNYTTFNSNLGVYTVSDISTESATTFNVSGLGFRSTSLSFTNYYNSTNTLLLQLFIVNGTTYTKDELPAAGFYLSAQYELVTSPYEPTLWIADDSGPTVTTLSCVNITLSHYYFPAGPIEVSNKVLTIGGVNIRDKQILIFNKLNNTDTYYTTVNSSLQILNSVSTAYYPDTILKSTGIFMTDGIIEEPLILPNSFISLNSSGLTQLSVPAITGSVATPAGSRFMYISLTISIGNMIDQDYLIPNNSIRVNFILDTDTVKYLSVFSNQATDSNQSEHSVGIKTIGSTIELTYTKDISSSTACLGTWGAGSKYSYPPPTITECLAIPDCSGIPFVDSYFPTGVSDGNGGSLLFFGITDCRYAYIG